MQLIDSGLYAYRYIWRTSKYNLLLAIVIEIFQGFVPFFVLWITKEMINEVVAAAQSGTGYNKPVIYLSIQMIALSFSYFLRHISTINETRIENVVRLKIKQTILQRVDKTPYLTFEDPKFYDSFQRISHGQGNVISIVRDTLEVGRGIITVITLIGFLFNISWILFLVVFICIIPILWLELKFGEKRYGLFLSLTSNERRERYLTTLLHSRDTMKEIRLFSLGNYLIHDWKRIYNLNVNEKMKMLKKYSFGAFFTENILAIGYCFSGLVVIYFILNGSLKVGEFIAVLQAVQTVQGTLTNSARTIAKIYEDSFLIKELREFLQINDEENERQKERKRQKITHLNSIEINNLTFNYPHLSTDTIKNINFEIKAGKKVAIIGENGSGKTTLIKCITGLYDIDPDMIHINGFSLDEVDIHSYQERLSVLFQDFIKYEYSALLNIGFGNINDLDCKSEIKSAAEQTGIHNYINNLPDSYNTLLGRMFDGGYQLSEGQWQKLALSRAIFRNSDLIILDEPTAALDPKAEVEIMKRFFEFSEGQSVIFITHRIGAVWLADEILVMKNGRIVEQGTHEELMKINGDYKKMYLAQSQWYTKREDVVI